MYTVENQIRYYVSRHYTVPTPTIQPDHRLRQDLGLNEWEFLDILVHIEQTFNVNLPDEELNTQLTVGQLSHLIHQRATTHAAAQ